MTIKFEALSPEELAKLSNAEEIKKSAAEAANEFAARERLPKEPAAPESFKVSEDLYPEQRIGGPSESKLEDLKFMAELAKTSDVNTFCTVLRSREKVSGSIGDISTDEMAKAIETVANSAINPKVSADNYQALRNVLGRVLTSNLGIRDGALARLDALRAKYITGSVEKN